MGIVDAVRKLAAAKLRRDNAAMALLHQEALTKEQRIQVAMELGHAYLELEQAISEVVTSDAELVR